MTRFVLDAPAVLRLVESGVRVAPSHQLLAPTLVRSQTLSLLHEAVHAGDLAPDEGRARLDRVGELKIRLLGDAVLRRTAWRLADQLGWASTYGAEYVALTRLQGDALVALDPELAAAAARLVPTAPFEALLTV